MESKVSQTEKSPRAEAVDRSSHERRATEERDHRIEQIRATLDEPREVEDDQKLWGDYARVPLDEHGQIRLSVPETKKLKSETTRFFDEVKSSKVATTQGYKVAAVYDAKVEGWTTRSKIIEVAGKRMFALCSYPASRIRRTTDRILEWFSGDPMRKPKPKNWKRTVESRNNIPTMAGTPENMVVMPFIESINAYDVFAHQRDIKDFGPFEWTKNMSVEDRVDMLEDVAAELSNVHAHGKTWGEAILPNVIFTKEKKPIFIDPETTYEKISIEEQKATDLRNLITSSCGALARSENRRDFQQVAQRILRGYGDPSISEHLSSLCARKLSWRQKFFFNIFSKFRIGSSDLEEFEVVRKAILKTLNG